MGIFVFRFIVILLISAGGYFHPPFGLGREAGAGVAFVLGAAFMFFETRIRRAQFKVIWSAAVGTLLGVLLGWLIGTIYKSVVSGDSMAAFIRIFFLVIMPYIGFIVGTRKSEWLDPAHIFGFFKEKSVARGHKILDTSVIIDGRIADICDTSFIEGTLVVPQFILKELQIIADSADGMKRQRGRRGLDVLDHLQKSSRVSVVISETDFPDVHDVDSKLIECAKSLDARIITNDFNLNKVAQL
ncbi:MAG TPA: PIN/TRAM domain-containing protein, partial [Acidobacteriota bacterium]|nr:PIN/TRAM domain-containing protein [Acidobacteriota bacterium]